MPEIERRDYPELPTPGGPFHHSVRWGNLLFLCGNTARGTPAEKGSAAEQTEAILQKMKIILEANGGSMRNLVKVTSFVTDLRVADQMTEVRRKYYEGALPASTQVSGGSPWCSGPENRDRSYSSASRLDVSAGRETMNHEQLLAKAEGKGRGVLTPLQNISGVRAEVINNVVGHQAFGLTLDVDPTGMAVHGVVTRLTRAGSGMV